MDVILKLTICFLRSCAGGQFAGDVDVLRSTVWNKSRRKVCSPLLVLRIPVFGVVDNHRSPLFIRAESSQSPGLILYDATTYMCHFFPNA